MFEDFENKLQELAKLRDKQDEIDLAYANDTAAIETAISDIGLDDNTMRKYAVGKFAIDNYRKCKNMSVEEAYLFVDNLFAVEEELAKRNQG